MFLTPWATCDGHAPSLLLYLVAPGVSGVRLLQGIFQWHTRHLQWCFLPTAASVLSVFLVFDILYLTVLLCVGFSLVIAF
jgi:hypothetical protein